MKFLIKYYPKTIPPNFKISKIKSLRVVTDESPPGHSEFLCRQEIVRGMLDKGFFVKRILPQEERAG